MCASLTEHSISTPQIPWFSHKSRFIIAADSWVAVFINSPHILPAIKLSGRQGQMEKNNRKKNTFAKMHRELLLTGWDCNSYHIELWCRFRINSDLETLRSSLKRDKHQCNSTSFFFWDLNKKEIWIWQTVHDLVFNWKRCHSHFKHLWLIQF